MKRVLLSVVLAVGLSGGLGSVLLAGDATTQPTTQPAEAKWVCPMNCEGSASDKPGNCPVCGMKLEKAKKVDKAGKHGEKADKHGHGHSEPKPDKSHDHSSH